MILILAFLSVALFATIIYALLIGQRAERWKGSADYRLELVEYERERRNETIVKRDAWQAFAEENVMRGQNRSCVACGHRTHADDCLFVKLKAAA